MNIKVLFTIGILGSAMAAPKIIQNIDGGSRTDIGQYPFISSMQYAWSSTWWVHQCAGSLLTSVVVLSAANCYYGDPMNHWRVRLGSSHSQTGGTIHNILQIVIHESYHPSHKNFDIAIVRLANGAVFGPNIGTAQIAGPTYRLQDNTPVWTVGWETLRSGFPSSSDLQHGQIFTINWQVCAQDYASLKAQPDYINYPDVTNIMSCTGIPNQEHSDSCLGDAGGPIVHNGNVVYSLISWGHRCGVQDFPSVNTDIPSLTDWILANA